MISFQKFALLGSIFLGTLCAASAQNAENATAEPTGKEPKRGVRFVARELIPNGKEQVFMPMNEKRWHTVPLQIRFPGQRFRVNPKATEIALYAEAPGPPNNEPGALVAKAAVPTGATKILGLLTPLAKGNGYKLDLVDEDSFKKGGIILTNRTKHTFGIRIGEGEEKKAIQLAPGKTWTFQSSKQKAQNYPVSIFYKDGEEIVEMTAGTWRTDPTRTQLGTIINDPVHNRPVMTTITLFEDSSPTAE